MPHKCIVTYADTVATHQPLVIWDCPSTMTATSGWIWRQSDMSIRLRSNPTYCINAEGGEKAKAKLMLFPCEPMTSNMQWVSSADGTIRLNGMRNVGFNVDGGIGGDPNNRRLWTYDVDASDNEQFMLGSLPPTQSTEATAILVAADHLCDNRGSIGGTGGYSVIVNSLDECVTSVTKNPVCGTQFSYSTKDKYCDCVPANPGVCTLHTDQGTANAEYNTLTLSPYFYIKWNLALCDNRGGFGGNNVYSTKKNNLQECAAAVATNPKCGLEFSYGRKDHWCDCVPRGKGPCTYHTDSGTQFNAYSVYTLAS